ncbi:MAG: DUF177 domain-containing protein, partial [Bradyrhizobium sp.]
MSQQKRPRPSSSSRPWSVPVKVEDVPEAGLRIELEPDEATRAAIAGHAGVEGLPQLAAGFDLMWFGNGGLRVAGLVSATVDQHCVVTLEPMRAQIEEPIELVFTADAAETGGPLAVDAADPPESLANGVVDLG